MSFDQTEERSRRDSDAGSDKVAVRSKVFRDSAGRIRTEVPDHIQLIDPVAGSRVVLMTSAPVAYRMPWPRSTGQFGFGPPAGAPSSHEMEATGEEIGRRFIEGIEFVGTRVVFAVKGEPGKTATAENWYSDEFKLIGFALTSSPKEAYTARIENLRRDEPSAELFTIPRDYKILELPTQNQR